MTTRTAATRRARASSIDCAPYEAFGDLKGKTVTVYTSITAPEDEPHIASYKPFEDCTGVEIKYEGSKEFEAQLPVRVKGGNAPDIAYVPQPGLLSDHGRDRQGQGGPAPRSRRTSTRTCPTGKGGAPSTASSTRRRSGANVKSFVWYSPQAFKDKGYEVPKTWAELLALSRQDRRPTTPVTRSSPGVPASSPERPPAGRPRTGSRTSSSAPRVLRSTTSGSTTRSRSTTPPVATALAEVGKILKNDKYVNGGFGDVKTIASTAFQDAGQPILEGACYMHRQASFYAANWPEGTKVAPDGDVWAFYLPSMDESTKPVLVGGEFTAAFADRPEVKAFQTYLSSTEWANERAKTCGVGGCVTANKNADPSAADEPGRQAVGRDPHRQGGARRASTVPTSCRAPWVRARSGRA